VETAAEVPGTMWLEVKLDPSGVGTGPVYPPKDAVVAAAQAGLDAAGIKGTVSK
jgi:hypothetical protein